MSDAATVETKESPQHRWSRKNREQGLCGNCGRKPDPGRARCPRCLEAGRKQNRRWRERQKEGQPPRPPKVDRKARYHERIRAGLCGRCGAARDETHRTLCPEHARRTRDYTRAAVERRRAAQAIANQSPDPETTAPGAAP